MLCLHKYLYSFFPSMLGQRIKRVCKECKTTQLWHSDCEQWKDHK